MNPSLSFRTYLVNMMTLFKECEIRRLGDGREAVEQAVRWLPAESASVGAVVRLDEGERWEIVSAPEPALAFSDIRRLALNLPVATPSA